MQWNENISEKENINLFFVFNILIFKEIKVILNERLKLG